MGDFSKTSFLRGSFWISLSLGCLSLLIHACASQKKNQTLVRECVLPDDQSATLSGRWSTVPVPIAVKAATFEGEELGALTRAADTWNAFSGGSLGFQILNYGEGGIPNESAAGRPPAVCAQRILQNDTYSGQVVIYKQTSWPYSNHSAIALTSFCPVPARNSQYPLIFMALMELNYQDFFGDGKKKPDLQSIFLHELGHLIGLDHSCDFKKKAGFPDCRNGDLPENYFQAAMYPVVSFDDAGAGETKRQLGENDQGRTNCLYKEFNQGQ